VLDECECCLLKLSHLLSFGSISNPNHPRFEPLSSPVFNPNPLECFKFPKFSTFTWMSILTEGLSPMIVIIAFDSVI
jgi:hypothetical protein